MGEIREIQELEKLVVLMQEAGKKYFDKEDIKIVSDIINDNQRALKLAQCQENIELLTGILEQRGRVLDQVGDTLVKFPTLNDFFVQKQTKYQSQLNQYKEYLAQEMNASHNE